MARNLGKFLCVLMAMIAAPVWAAGPDVDHINARSFSIPIDISGGQKDKIAEIELFVSPDEGKTWNRTSVIPPEKGGFAYTAPIDGIYWFKVCTIDVNGKREPPDIYKSDKVSKILVDTLPPTLRIAKTERQGENILVSWEVQETNPDLNALKLEYKTTDGYWYPVTVTPALIGQGQFRSPHNGPVTVRMKASDLAGNQAEAVAEVVGRKDDLATGLTTTSMQMPSGGQTSSATPAPNFPTDPVPVQPAPSPPYTPPSYASNPPSSNTASSNSASIIPNTYAGGGPGMSNGNPGGQAGGFQGGNPNTNSGYAGGQTVGYQGGYSTPTNASRMTINTQLPTAPPELVRGPGYGSAVRYNGDRNWAPPATAPTGGGIGLPPGNSPGYVATRWSNNTQTHVINSTQVSLDYRVDRVGPSGVGAVDLYLTEDEGRTWKKYDSDANLQPPMVVNLPGEGAFGLRLVVTSKAGLGRRPPLDGEPPDMRVEVDMTAPVVKLYRPEPDPRRRDAIILTWQASDHDLAPSPITLQWAERPDGVWQTIATNLTNSGRYVWTVDSKLVRVYLRVVARDMAGNQGFDETADPILVDLNEPEAKIVGISSGPRRP
ncbi:MAG TPA: hypothetical protein VGP68_01500 [Gemmataceae bacterium]|nr:hypothetical protein [Gemmataceae bacterium]